MAKKTLLKVFDVYLYDVETGKILGVQENLTSTALSQAVEKAEIRNGRSNSKWSEIEYNKSVTFELSTNVFDKDMLALKCGVKPEEATEMYTEAFTETVSSSRELTLPATPKDGEEVQIINPSTGEVISDEGYEVSGTTVTFDSLSNTDVRVLPYLTDASEKEVTEIVIDADKFASAVKCVAKTVEVSEDSKVTNYVELVLNVAKPASNFSLTTSADVTNGNEDSITIEALPDAKNKLATLRFIPV